MVSTPVCRTCLAKKANKNISELQSQDKQSSNDIVLFCLDIQLEKCPQVTTKLCVKCFNKILSFYDFKLLALKNDEFLRNEINIKNEETSSDSINFNGADGYEENLESQIEDKIYIQNSINMNESKDVLSSDVIKLDDIKVELVKTENTVDDSQSDDELLSVIKKIKYEYIPSNVDDTKENEIVKNKKRKRYEPIIQKGTGQVCEECGKTVRNLKEHSNRHLPPGKKKRIPCKICDKTFASYSARYRHNKVKHLGIKKSCPICKKWVVNVRQHRLVMHDSSDLPVPCPVCDRRFISKSALDAHSTLHTRDRPFDCDLCDKKFRTKILMLQHKRSVHDKEKSHLCQYCSKSFFKKYHLQMHIRTHTKEKPHECPDCSKCFATSNILKNHRLIHSDVRAFACTLCDMTFVRSGYLRAHMISHTKEKRYPCKYCGFKFGRSDHRKRHESTAHERNLLSTAVKNKCIINTETCKS